MKDSAGLRVAPGAYTVTVSYTTQAGKTRKRIEQVLVTDERTVGGSAAEAKAVTSNAPNPQPLVDGTGTTNRIPKFTDGDTLASSSIVDVGGNISIGKLAAPVTGVRLEINGYTRMNTAGSGGYMQFGTPNGETGFGWIKAATSTTPAARADIRFDGERLALAAGSGAGVPSNTGVFIDTAGRVGIGAASTTSDRLYVSNSAGTGIYSYGKIYGVWGNGSNTGLYGTGLYGVYGFGGAAGVAGISTAAGVFGESSRSTGWGVYGRNKAGGFAGFFDGKVHVEGAFDYSSDRNMKTNFSAVNPRSILNKLSTLPVQTWRYKTEDKSVRHLGPVAQDFRAAFGLGTDDRSIGAVDASGVALAAIQGLYQLMLEKDSKIEQLQARVARLESISAGRLRARRLSRRPRR